MTKPPPVGGGFVMSWCGTSGMPVDINARHALRDSSQDLVGDGPHEFREFLSSDGKAVLLADEGHRVTGHCGWDVGDVEGTDIHTDTTHDRREPSPHDRMSLVGQSTQITVGVPDGDERHAGRPLRDERPPIPDTVASRQFLHYFQLCSQ